MLNIKKLGFLFVFFINFAMVTAYGETPSDTLSHLLKTMHTMQADFVQTILDKKGTMIQETKGHMDLQRPNQFRWEVLTPNKQLIVTNGKRLWVYDPDLEQVTIRNLVKAAGETPAMLLSDENLALGQEFTVQTLPSSHSLRWFYLTPKDQSAIISALKLGFSFNVLREMHLQDHLGHMTRIQFNNIKLNGRLANSLFLFKPPAHTDIIDETRGKN